MDEEHGMKVKCKFAYKTYSPCEFMSMSLCELQEHEEQPHPAMDHDYAPKVYIEKVILF